MTVHATPGRHVLADFHGVAAAGLSDAAALERQLLAAADAAGARVLSAHFHHFGEGAGVTGVVMLSESHISIHTWPEHGYAALDVFMCGAPGPSARWTACAPRWRRPRFASRSSTGADARRFSLV